MSPCHSHLRDRAEAVKRGVWQAGGYPVEMPALSVGEVMVKPTTMLYRNFLAMEVRGIPALASDRRRRAAGRLRQVHARPSDGRDQHGRAGDLLPGRTHVERTMARQKTGAGTHTKKYWDELRAGNITQDDWVDLESRMTRSIGTCNTMGTASTMTSIVDAMGLTLPGASSIPAVDSGHSRMASACGARIVEMIWEDLRTSRLLDERSFHNGLVAYMALGGSTNAAVHLIAMARRAGIALTLDDMAAMAGKVPVCANLFPSGEYLMEDFYFAGGLLALLKKLEAHLELDAPTVNGTHARRKYRRCRLLERRRHPRRGQSGRAAVARKDAGGAARQSGAERCGDEILRGATRNS